MVRVLAVQVFKVPLHEAHLAKRLQHRFKVAVVLNAAEGLELGEGLGLALSHFQRKVKAVVRDLFSVAPLGVLKAAVDAPVFRGFGGHLLKTEKDLLSVGDDFTELEYFFVSGHRRYLSFSVE